MLSRIVRGVPAGLWAAGGLVTGFAAAEVSVAAGGPRAVGGVFLVLGVVLANAGWRRRGVWVASLLTCVYFGVFVGSHALAKVLGAWPAVGVAAGVIAALSWWLVESADRTAVSSVR